jgi:serine protease Do
MEPGDVIVRADGRPVDRVSTLQRIVRTHEPGTAIDVDVMRYGQRRSFRVKLEERQEAPQLARGAAAPAAPASRGEVKLGVSVEAVTPEFAREANLTERARGVRVIEVSRSGPARNILFPGTDVITDVLYPAKRQVRTVNDLQAVLQDLKAGDVVSLRVYGTAEPLIGTRVVNVRVAE